MDLVSQVWVTVFGLTALGCMQTHRVRVRVRRWGVVLGLIGQPAWYAQLVLLEVDDQEEYDRLFEAHRDRSRRKREMGGRSEASSAHCGLGGRWAGARAALRRGRRVRAPGDPGPFRGGGS